MSEASPFIVFEHWYEEALQLPTNNPAAMALSTVDENNRPSSRIVLLKSWDEAGFVFFTNYNSRKTSNLTANPTASLLFFWDSLGKQIRIEGSLKKVSRETSESYFQSRPLESQWGAWASKQSEKLEDPSDLAERFNYYKKKYPAEVPLPEFWGGYLMIPDYFEFWQTREHRLHERTVYQQQSGEWISFLLYP